MQQQQQRSPLSSDSLLHRADISTSASGTTFSSSTNHRISRSSCSTSFSTSWVPTRHKLEVMLLRATSRDEHGGGGTFKGTAGPYIDSSHHHLNISQHRRNDSPRSHSDSNIAMCNSGHVAIAIMMNPLSHATSFQTSSS